MKIIHTFGALGALYFAMSIAAAVTASAAARDARSGEKLRVYLGTYTGGDSKGIYVCELDLGSGQLSQPRLAAEAVNPSFLAIHPSRKFLYAVGEISELAGKPGGGVLALAVDAQSGQLTALNQQPSGGAGPCHLTVDATGKNVLVANYGGGSVACLPIGKDGRLGEATAFVQHKGSSVNQERQEGPHAHSINVDADNRFAIAADLGLDKLLVYRFDAARGTLVPNEPPSASVTPGGGPRHFAFHPSGTFAYTNNEITSTVTAFSYDAARGTLTELQTISTLPHPVEGNSTAEIRVHPTGRFLYVSNRGHNSIAIFAIDPSTGQLSAAGHEPTRGRVPRNFNLDPSARYLLAANQDTHNVVVFRVNHENGKLTATGSEIRVPSPVCVRFVNLDAGD